MDLKPMDTGGPLAAARLADHEAAGLRLPGRSLALFTLHLRVLMEAGVSLPDALEALSNGEDLKAAQVAEHLLRRVSQGSQLSEALAELPGVFDRFFLRMIRAAEANGRLLAVLEQLSELQEVRERRLRKLKGALAYPLLVLLLSVAMTAFIVYTMLPGYLSIFATSGLELPFLTRLLVTGSQSLPGLLLGLGLLAVIAVLVQPPTVRKDWLYAIPLVRRISTDYQLANVCTTLGWMLRTEVPLQVAVATVAKGGTGWSALDLVLEEAQECLMQGNTLAESLDRHDVFPGHLLKCITVGEESGKTPEFLLLAAGVMERNCDYAIETALSLIEPLILLFLGVVVAAVVLAALLPTFSLLQAL